MTKYVQKYDLSGIPPFFETVDYVVYKLGYINEDLAKGVRVDKATNEQTDIQIKLTPYPMITAIIKNGILQKVK